MQSVRNLLKMTVVKLDPSGLMAFWVVMSVVFAMATFSTASDVNSVFEDGKYQFAGFEVRGSDSFWNDVSGWGVPKCNKDTSVPIEIPAGEKPVRTLRVVAPKQPGKYPVIHLQHGFLLDTASYTELMQHLASYGYIVVAPQMPGIGIDLITADASNEIAYAAAVINWYPLNLAAAIKRYGPLDVEPDLQNATLVGHSRGGKVSFALAKGFCKTSGEVQFVAIAGLDPVDGATANTPIAPEVLPYPPQVNGLNLTFPTLIIGAALGTTGWVPCAPEGVNELQFYENSRDPAFRFVAVDFGHMDFLNQKLGLSNRLIAAACTRYSGREGREPMRRFSGGMVIAFLQAILKHNPRAFNYFLDDPGSAPIKVNPVNNNGRLDEALVLSL